ncbi:HD domain-containing protein [Christiangramia sabulilitoris]|uniref:HD family phosphohydrolase n=1 Tax=Christiangramia sabulilitoris TaxID=2583991 RepID=A0A550I3L0_9FLAO|nr:HD family phosphohydrolase [Christiangramia sabulilitoris]TRO65531.1 HD family phosphohydrolase [Christiangramia sabulilitoris]
MGNFLRRTIPDMDRTQIFDNLHTRLENDLPYYLYYHCPAHTKSVIDRCEFLAQLEKISEQETYLVKIAGLYHDAGFLIGRKDHETKSCELATAELPEYGFTKAEIKLICGMISATRIPQKTHNIYEKIVADADLFYLGTDEYNFYSNQLYRELKYFNPELNENEWFEIQLNFLNAHRFHTEYGKETLEPIKQINKQKLIESHRK